MRPYPEEVLRALQAGVAGHFSPELTSNYAKAQFAFAMLLFGIATRDYDTAVPDLIEGNAALRTLLAEADAAFATIDDDRARAARDVIGGLPPVAADLRLSSLRAEFDGLREAVCRLAPVIEPAADDTSLAPLRAVREQMFAWFAADAKRRIVPVLNV